MRKQRALSFDEIELVSLGVDWITVSQKRDCPATPLHEVVSDLLYAERGEGNFMRPWSSYGYDGFHCGRVDLGSRSDGEIARLSGERAARDWWRVWSVATGCSRIDLQATFRLRRPVHGEILKVYNAARRNVPEVGKPPIVTLLKSTDGSSTVYIGKRTSEQMARVYDKGIQSKLDHYKNCVRFEVEFKSKRALSVVRRLDSSTQRDPMVHSELRRFFSAHLERCPWFPATVHADMPRDVVDRPGNLTDAARSLQWLAKCVRPTVSELCTLGRLNEVMVALGLCSDGPSN